MDNSIPLPELRKMLSYEIAKLQRVIEQIAHLDEEIKRAELDRKPEE